MVGKKIYRETGAGGVAVAGRGGASAAGADCLGAGLTGMYNGPVWPQPDSRKASAMRPERRKWNGEFTDRITGDEI
jgi:hypothetical protein